MTNLAYKAIDWICDWSFSEILGSCETAGSLFAACKAVPSIQWKETELKTLLQIVKTWSIIPYKEKEITQAYNYRTFN